MLSTGSPRAVPTEHSSLEKTRNVFPIISHLLATVRVSCHFLIKTDSATVRVWTHYGLVYKGQVEYLTLYYRG